MNEAQRNAIREADNYLRAAGLTTYSSDAMTEQLKQAAQATPEQASPDVAGIATRAGLTWKNGLNGSGFHINSLSDLEAFYHHAVAHFLERTKQYITNDATREACIAAHKVTPEPVAQVSDLFPSVRNKLHAQGFDADAPLYTHPAPGVPEEPKNTCAQCKKSYRKSEGSIGCQKCAPGIQVSEVEFRKPLTNN